MVGLVSFEEGHELLRELSDVDVAIKQVERYAEALGRESDLGKQWERRRLQELDAGNLRALLAALRRQASHNTEAEKCVDYIDGNRSRMRYDQFHAAGLCTSTGVVEAGCKTAIGVRCKRAGMHWTLAGVDAIIALRCSKLSGRFEDFWERRAHRPRACA
jgi:hypothetical protein